MSNSWSKEFSQFLLLGLLAGLAGLVLGQVMVALLAYSLGYLGWYFYNMHRMERWLKKEKKYTPPQASGVWADLINEVYYQRQRARRRSKRLVKLLNRFRETTCALPDGIILLKEHGDIEWWNDAAEQLLKLKYPQDVGQRMYNLIRHPKFIAYASGEVDTPDVTINSPEDDEIILNIRIIPYGKDQSLVIIRDVTLLVQVEQMRRDFVGNISHELRTPLTVLSGYIENLQEDKHPNEDLQRALYLMGQQTRRMQQLTEDLMLLSRLESSQSRENRQVVNVVNMVTSLKEEAMVLSGERHHTIILEADDNVALRGDPKELDSIFTNLVINAVNYTPDGGAIRIRWYADDTGAHFEVHDTGIGIANHHISRLTERFYRADEGRSRAVGGSGLGLAIVKHALQQHHGQLRIDSEVGRGSTFICDFPPELVVLRGQSNMDKAG